MVNLKAVIFDLNGTVISDEFVWGGVFKKVLKGLGVDEDKDYPQIGGIGVEENWKYFLEKYDVKTDKSVDELSVISKSEYKDNLDNISLKPGFKDFAVELKESDIRIALATSSTWDNVEVVLTHFGFEEFFDTVTTGEEVISKKPDPSIFVLTADKLQLDNSQCLVFEDSQAGIEAAKSAQMKVVGVYRDLEHKSLLGEADLLVKDFRELTPEIVEKI